MPVPSLERFRGFYSNLFVVPKKGGVRPILDLKALNSFVKVQRFRMESVRSIMASLHQGDFMASLDIMDAYLHVPVCTSHQRYLRFAIGEDHYQFVALPFGLASAPRVFTKVLAPILALLRQRGIAIVGYLDDLLLRASSGSELEEDVSITCRTLQEFGWFLNLRKSVLVPSQRLEHLGLVLDSGETKVFLPSQNLLTLQSAVRQLLTQKWSSLRFCMRVLGLMVASFEAVLYAQSTPGYYRRRFCHDGTGSHLLWITRFG